MEAGRAKITGLVAIVCAAAVVLVLNATAAAGGEEPGEPLRPDLIVEDPAVISYENPRGSGTATIRFSHTTSNVGGGPLEIYPDLATETCGDKGDRGRVAHQAIFDDQGNLAEDRTVGCMIFHDIHNHYHFEDFALYELYRERSGRLKSTSEKMSFCVFDLSRTHPGLPGSPDVPYYSFTNCDRDDGTHGISVGYADIYGSSTPGQELDVSNRRRGRYCLVARADPIDRLSETLPGGEENNSTEVRIRLNPGRETKYERPVKRIAGACKYSER